MSASKPSNPLPPPPPDDEELVHADDAVIGRAIRRSLLVFAALAVVGLGAWYLLRPKLAPLAAQVTTLTTPVAPSRTVPEIPPARFTDVTAAAGIRFVHYNGAEGDKLLPEKMGGAAAFFEVRPHLAWHFPGALYGASAALGLRM